MFLFRSSKSHRNTPLDTTQPDRPAEDAASRTARHLAMLRRIGELGMEILESVAVEARAEALDQAVAKPEPTPRAARAPRRDARRNFALVSRTLRDTITLEATIAAGKIPASPRELPNTQRPAIERPAPKDPRRAPISEYLHDAIEDSTLPKPTRAALHDQVEPLIDHHLENDPNQDQRGGDIAIDICQTLGIPFKTSRMQDELLVHPGQTVTEAFRERQARKSTGPDPPQ